MDTAAWAGALGFTGGKQVVIPLSTVDMCNDWQGAMVNFFSSSVAVVNLLLSANSSGLHRNELNADRLDAITCEGEKCSTR